MLTVIYTYYNQYEHLHNLIELCNSYSNSIKDKLTLLFIDDCSTYTAEPILKNLKCNYNLFYIQDDIFWNNGGAKNLGITQSTTEWNILLDIDMFISNNMFLEIIPVIQNTKIDTLYKLLSNERTLGWEHYNKTWDLYESKSYPGCLISTKQVFERIGYFDEDFCGRYGFEDKAVIHRAKQKQINIRKIKTKNKLIQFSSGTTKVANKINTSEQRILYNNKCERPDTWSENILRFNWKQIL